MKTQELFDKVAKHLLTQNAKAINPGTRMCEYRALDGKTCAVGCLINEKHYDAAFEGVGIGNYDDSSVKVVQAVQASLSCDLTRNQINMLADLQQVHDDFAPEEWHDRLFNTAKDYNLSTAIIHA